MAHDDIPYSSAGSDDVYKHIKEAGESEFGSPEIPVEDLLEFLLCGRVTPGEVAVALWDQGLSRRL